MQQSPGLMRDQRGAIGGVAGNRAGEARRRDAGNRIVGMKPPGMSATLRKVE